jgi:hypothetical protein
MIKIGDTRMSRYRAMVEAEMDRMTEDEGSIKPDRKEDGHTRAIPDEDCPRCPVHGARLLPVVLGEVWSGGLPWYCPSCLMSYPDPIEEVN